MRPLSHTLPFSQFFANGLETPSPYCQSFTYASTNPHAPQNKRTAKFPAPISSSDSLDSRWLQFCFHLQEMCPLIPALFPWVLWEILRSVQLRQAGHRPDRRVCWKGTGASSTQPFLRDQSSVLFHSMPARQRVETRPLPPGLDTAGLKSRLAKLRRYLRDLRTGVSRRFGKR